MTSMTTLDRVVTSCGFLLLRRWQQGHKMLVIKLRVFISEGSLGSYGCYGLSEIGMSCYTCFVSLLFAQFMKRLSSSTIWGHPQSLWAYNQV